MRQLGDAYVKSEFRLHKTATKPEQIEMFIAEWDKYLDQILMTARARDSVSVAGSDKKKNGETGAAQAGGGAVFEFGADLAPDVELSEEQRAQLEKLRAEAEKALRR